MSLPDRHLSIQSCIVRSQSWRPTLDEIDRHVAPGARMARPPPSPCMDDAGERVWTTSLGAIQNCLVEPPVRRLRAASESPHPENPATNEAARRSLDAAVDALRDLQAAQHQVERLVRQALESVSQQAPPSA